MPKLKRTHTCFYSVGTFLSLTEDKWIKTMEKNAHQPPAPNQIAAWKDSFAVLQQALGALPEEFHELYIIFEYALPRYPVKPGKKHSPWYVFADAILLSKERVVTLEFKQKKEDYFGDAHQARKYRRRIQDFHDESRGMGKGAILVLTRATELREKYFKVDCCSGDLLSVAIVEQFANKISRHPNAKKWCASTFSCHKPKVVRITTPLKLKEK
jgi:hypothetical protein